MARRQGGKHKHVGRDGDQGGLLHELLPVQGRDHGRRDDVALLRLHVRVHHDSIREVVRMKFYEGDVISTQNGELNSTVTISMYVISGAIQTHLIKPASEPLQEVCLAQR